MLVAEVFVDPAVSRAKFEREVAGLLEQRWEHHKRGWLLMEAEYPTVFVVFAAANAHPKGLLFGAELEFTNYDVWPPSLTLVDPLSRVPYTNETLPPGLQLVRVGQPNETGEMPVENFLQRGEGAGRPPFVCLPGVREYHQHPAHTGDSWFLHRQKGEGTLYFLLEKLYELGVAPVTGWQIALGIGPMRMDLSRAQRS